MVLCKKQIILFGGYNDNTVDYKYFNDVYAFDLKEYKWKKLEPTGKSMLCMINETWSNKNILQVYLLLQGLASKWLHYQVAKC
jgi:N-acetylneuraminic acid mutarotase